MTAPTIPAIGDATLFPVAPDGQFPVTLEEEWLTDVQPAASGAEVRVACRSVGVRTLTFTAAFLLSAELLAFRDRWLNAAQPLRFAVPVWPEFAGVTGIAGAVVSCDTTNRDFVAGGLAMLYYADPIGTDDRFELVTVESFDETSVTLADPPAETFPIYSDASLSPSAIIPVMTAWLDPPTVEELMVSAERMALTFREELPAIAGIDATIVEAVTPVAAAITVAFLVTNNGFERNQILARATVTDAAGVQIPCAPITWDVTPAPPTDPYARLTVSPDEQTARLELDYGANANHTLTATSGSASVGIGIIIFVL